jgi:hypothetical protein
LIDGLRLTDHERDLMQDLLTPVPEPTAISHAVTGEKRKAPTESDVEIVPDDFYQGLVEKMFPPSVHETIMPTGYEYISDIQATKDSEVHSSCLSPAVVEEEDDDDDESPAGLVMPVSNPLSVDEFFDLDEAASALSPLCL